MEEGQNNQLNNDNYVANREIGSVELPGVQGSPMTSNLFADIKPVELVPQVAPDNNVPINVNNQQVVPPITNNDITASQVTNNNESNIGNTVTIDPFVSSNIDVEEAVEEPVIQKVIDVEEEKRKKITKTILIVLGSILGILLIVTVAVILFSPKKKEGTIQRRELEDSSYSGVINRSIRDGEFDRELESALKSVGITTDKVYLISMDLDSDEILELVAYAENEEKHYLLQFDVDEEVLFDDSFPLNNKESFGYVYSISQNTSNWCSVMGDQYTIIHHRKMVLKKEDFDKEYYIVTQDFNGKKTLDNALEYQINGDFDATLLDEISITKESLLKDSQMTAQEMRAKAEDHFKQKKEEEDKNNAESEKAKLMEEQKNEVFGVNGVILRYGTYSQESGSYGDFTINKNGTCTIGSIDCNWSIVNHNFDGSDISSILIKVGDQEVYVSSWSSNRISDNSNWSVVYQG